ncbi:MAG: hypothetical protein LBL41_03015 [Bifidobacteriaceae bacterium]|jgi:hypothetical protein|nr:hypothetical protein [Bifidobacteriaceae bacterium]
MLEMLTACVLTFFAVLNEWLSFSDDIAKLNESKIRFGFLTDSVAGFLVGFAVYLGAFFCIIFLVDSEYSILLILPLILSTFIPNILLDRAKKSKVKPQSKDKIT